MRRDDAGDGVLFDVHLVYFFEHQDDPLPILHGVYSCKKIATAVASYLEREGHLRPEVLDRKAAKLIKYTEDGSGRYELDTYLIDDDLCPVKIDVDLNDIASRIIDGLTEEEKTIIMSSKSFG